VSSIIAAHTDNGLGIAGIAPGVKLMHLRSFDDTGNFPATGPYAGTLSAAAGIEYAVDHGADLVNNSWTVETGFSQVVADAIDYALDNGVHLVFGAANDNASTTFPAETEGIVAVAGIDLDGVKSSFSNVGSWVDVSAGGTFVPALDPTFGAVFFSGTSAASPLVGGRRRAPALGGRDLSTDDLRAILVEGAVDIDAFNPSHAGQLGSGHVNALASLGLLAPATDVGLALGGDTDPVLNA
jgi:thermitase